jgi:hypothetical protein
MADRKCDSCNNKTNDLIDHILCEANGYELFKEMSCIIGKYKQEIYCSDICENLYANPTEQLYCRYFGKILKEIENGDNGLRSGKRCNQCLKQEVKLSQSELKEVLNKSNNQDIAEKVVIENQDQKSYEGIEFLCKTQGIPEFIPTIKSIIEKERKEAVLEFDRVVIKKEFETLQNNYVIDLEAREKELRKYK